MNRSAKTTLTLCACAAALAGALVVLRRPPQRPPLASDTAGEAQRPVDAATFGSVSSVVNARVAEPARRRPPPAAPPPTIGEPALMSALRALGATDPARALELAREGNRRFPDSPDAAERSWTICKSLAALGRFAEAQQQAREMVQQYPDTTWASDVRRHLLSQPLEDPGQRGYGKSSELD